MLKKDYLAAKKEVKSLYTDEQELAFDLANEIITLLFEDKQYDLIVDLYSSKFLINKQRIFSFELAYALNERNKSDDAELIYEDLLKQEPNNTSMLNNLHLIYKKNDKTDDAWNLIRRAYELNPSDEVISRNFESLADEISIKEE